MFKTYLPNTPVFFCLGNNDAKYHYQTPREDDIAFFSFLYDLWFVQHPANTMFASPTLKKTFEKGGYYRVDITDTLSLLSLNTLPWNTK